MNAPAKTREMHLRGARLARNSLFNLLGQGLPLAAALVAIPPLTRGLGTDRFGLLTLAWMVIGYFSLFDLGLGRALTQTVSAGMKEGDDAHAPASTWIALAAMLALGLIGGGVMASLAPWMTGTLLNIPPEMKEEARAAFVILACCIPLVVLTAGLVGVLSAFHRFGVLNLIRVPMGALTFVAPLAVLPFSGGLVEVTLVLVVVRALAFIAHLVVVVPLLPRLRGAEAWRASDLRALWRFGAWMTVSNVIGPLMLYLDRFVIGSVLTVTAVAYYATPYEMMTKLLVVPGAILGVLFPAFATAHGRDESATARLFAGGTRIVALLMFPAVFIAVCFASEGLDWWLGTEFSRNGATVLQVLAVGVFVNAIAQVFATLVQGVGRPDLSAKLHLLEFPVYLPVLLLAVHRLGILGAALAWTGRVVADAGLLLLVAGRLVEGIRPLRLAIARGLVAALAVLALPVVVGPLSTRIGVALLVSGAYLPAAWFFVLGPSERSFIRGRLGLGLS